jgi:hypothetical protein
MKSLPGKPARTFAIALIGVAAGVSAAATVTQAQQATTPVEIDSARNMRFCEFIVIDGEYGDIYNTSGLNECPEDIWTALDTKAMAEEMDVDAIQLNGPHFWAMDSQTVGFGDTRDFGGIEARWGARVPAAGLSAAGGATPYTEFKTCKSQKMVYDAGQKVWEMLDADGNIYVLQAHEAEFTLDDLDTLGQKMKALPEGWSWRTRVLDDQLVLDLKAADCNMGIGDEFHQYYTLEPNDG